MTIKDDYGHCVPVREPKGGCCSWIAVFFAVAFLAAVPAMYFPDWLATVTYIVVAMLLVGAFVYTVHAILKTASVEASRPKVCPICGGDGYLDTGDAYGVAVGVECVCVGGPIDFLPDAAQDTYFAWLERGVDHA